MKFQNGAMGSVTFAGNTPNFENELKIFTEAGTVYTDAYGKKLEIFGKDRSPWDIQFSNSQSTTPHANFVNALQGLEPLRGGAIWRASFGVDGCDVRVGTNRKSGKGKSCSGGYRRHRSCVIGYHVFMPDRLNLYGVNASVISSDPREAVVGSRKAGFSGLLFDAYASSFRFTDLSATGRREFRHMLWAQNQQLIGLRVDLGTRGSGLARMWIGFWHNCKK